MASLSGMEKSISNQLREHNRPVSGAPIKEAACCGLAKDGVPVGSHFVKIEGNRSRGNSNGTDMLTGGLAGTPQQYIADKYNQATQRKVTISGDARKTSSLPIN